MASGGIDQRGLLQAWAGDGRSLLILVGVSLAFAGTFAIFLSTAGLLLPHDTAYLGMTTDELCAHHGCRIVSFMIHDRVAFGGALLAIGALYVWLAEFPLRAGRSWAWWALLVSGVLGFATFLLYLGYGYLDTWHGIGTLAMLPFFAVGLARSWPTLVGPRSVRASLRPAEPLRRPVGSQWGRVALLATAAGMALAGLVVMAVGVSAVFVPQDVSFMGASSEQLRDINPRLVPLMAHDRAGFGGAVFVTGLLVTWCCWCAERSRSLWQTLCIVWLVGFGAAVGVHAAVGYTDILHLGPALIAASVFAVGLVLSAPSMLGGSGPDERGRVAAPQGRG